MKYRVNPLSWTSDSNCYNMCCWFYSDRVILWVVKCIINLLQLTCQNHPLLAYILLICRISKAFMSSEKTISLTKEPIMCRACYYYHVSCLASEYLPMSKCIDKSKELLHFTAQLLRWKCEWWQIPHFAYCMLLIHICFEVSPFCSWKSIVIVAIRMSCSILLSQRIYYCI